MDGQTVNLQAFLDAVATYPIFRRSPPKPAGEK